MTDRTSIFLQEFEAVGRLHMAHFVKPQFAKYRKWRSSEWEGLGLFVAFYAYEHSRRPPQWPTLAADVLRDLSRTGIAPGDVACDAWKTFCQRAKTRGAGNPKNNPLAPSCVASGVSVLELVVDFIDPLPLALVTKLKMNNVQSAYATLMRVNGVGPKISSLFLRDLSAVSRIEVREDRWMLQPIDEWVERCAETAGIAGSRRRIATAIVETSIRENLNPELVNMGMWYFGARVCEYEHQFREAREPGNIRRFTDEYVKKLADVANAWQGHR